MPNTTMKTQIQVRRDTTANWLANKDVVPAAGEPCFDLELGTLKIWLTPTILQTPIK